jgi:hypothetical protein
VEDDLGPRRREGGADEVEVADVGDVEVEPAAHRVRHPAPRRPAQVVERRHVVAAGEQRVDEMGADEPGAAGDEDAHRRSLRGRQAVRAADHSSTLRSYISLSTSSMP